MTSVIDTSLVTEIVNLIKSVLSIFSVFPLNVAVYAGIAAIGIKMVKGLIPRHK